MRPPEKEWGQFCIFALSYMYIMPKSTLLEPSASVFIPKELLVLRDSDTAQVEAVFDVGPGSDATRMM
jgi:hypothetical protein